MKKELDKVKNQVKQATKGSGTAVSNQQIEAKQNIKNALQMAIFLKMTKEVEDKTGQKITTEQAKGHKSIKEELMAKQ